MMKQKIREFLNNGGLLWFFIALGIWHYFSPNSKYIEAIVYIGMLLVIVWLSFMLLLVLYDVIKKNIRAVSKRFGKN